MGLLNKLRKVKSSTPYNPANDNALKGSTEALEPTIIQGAAEIAKPSYAQNNDTITQGPVICDQKSEIIPEEPKKEQIPGTKKKAYDYVFKLVLLGEGGVGKTTLFERYVTGIFVKDAKMTVGVGIQDKLVEGIEGANGKRYNVMLQLWDIGGQERFQPFRATFYGGASGALLVYDVTRYTSFERLDGWLNEFYKFYKGTKTAKDENPPVIVLGNKADIEKRAVGREDAESWAKNKGLKYIETSAKTGENVEKTFTNICKEMITSRTS